MTADFTPLQHALTQARAAARPAEIEAADLPQTVEAAYAFALSGSTDVAAWKIGGANPWSQAVFDNDEIFFGALAPAEVFVETDALALLHGLLAPLGEPEIMLELGDPEAPQPFRRMGAGIEIPATVLPDALKPVLTGQISDRAGAGALWISAVQPFAEDRVGGGIQALFQHNSAPPVPALSDNVIGTPLGAARQFLDIARRLGAPLAPGQWIATGGLCPAVPLIPGDTLRFTIWGQETVLALSH